MKKLKSYKLPQEILEELREKDSSLVEEQYFLKSTEIFSSVSESDSLDDTIRLSEAKVVFEFLGFNQSDLSVFFEVDPSTLVRWKKEDKILTRLLSKAIKDMDKAIAKGVRIFGSEDNFSAWLQTENIALGHTKPAELMLKPKGLELVIHALDAISWGSVF